MQGLKHVQNLVKNNDFNSAIKIYVKALQNIDDFIVFLGITSEEQVGSQKTYLTIGEAMNTLLSLANTHPSDFQVIFDTLYYQYLKLVTSHDTLSPLQLYITLVLLQMLSMFIRKENTDVTNICDLYIDKYAKNNEELPSIYIDVFAEHCVFGYIQKRQYDKAYMLEKHANMLQTMMNRDGYQLLSYIAMLVQLRRHFGEDMQAIIEALGLRFGEKEVETAINQVKQEFEKI